MAKLQLIYSTSGCEVTADKNFVNELKGIIIDLVEKKYPGWEITELSTTLNMFGNVSRVEFENNGAR